MLRCLPCCAVLVALSASGVVAQQSVIHAEGAAPSSPVPPIDTLLSRAEQFFRVGNYNGALADFSRAYDLLDGDPRRYVVLHNMAACHERMFRYDVAVRLYEQYLREAPEADQDRDNVAATVQMLQRLLARLGIHSNVAAEVWLDDRHLGVAPGEFWIPAGQHVVELRAQGYEVSRQVVLTAPGEERTVSLTLERLSTWQGVPRGYFWVATTVTAAALVTGTIFGVNALNVHHTASRDAKLAKDVSAERREISAFSTRADIFFGVAALGAVTATVLFFITDWDTSGEVSPALGPAVAGVTVRGRL